MFGLVGDFRSMMSHLGVCWGPLVIKFQSQRTHGSVGIEFGVGFGRLLSHWTVCWAFVGTFWGYVVLLLGVLGSVGGLWGRTHVSVGIEVGVGFDHLYVLFKYLQE